MKKITTIVIFFLVLFALPTTINAQQTTKQELSITAFPAVQDKEVNLGDKVHLQVQFKNGEDAFIAGKVKVADYIIKDKSGSLQLVEGDQKKPKYAASSWITLSADSITIPPNDVVTVDIFATIPQDVPRCGSYAVVYFQPALPGINEVKSNLNSKSAITAKIGALINFQVKGKICKENLSVISFGTKQAFQEYGPVKISFELLNSGDIHLFPRGVITMTNLLNKYVDSEQIKDQRIFPETIKKYENQLGSKWMIGRYKIELSASYGTTGKKLISTAYVWVFPWRVGLIALLSLIIVYLIIRSMLSRSRAQTGSLKQELEEEKNEIEKLKEQLRKRTD